MNSFFLTCGAPPLAVARMRLNYDMLVDTRSITERYALFSGDYDTQKIRFLAALMQPQSVFVDVGANVGFYTIPLADSVRAEGGRVFAFEPHPSNFKRLKHNVELNGLGEVVTLVNTGLSSEAGEADLTMREDFALGSETGNAAISIDDDIDRALPTVRIRLAALDDFYGTTVPRVDVMKVDIEGHEDLFMNGARKTIAAERPYILIEVNKEYYRRRGVDLYSQIRLNLPKDYGVYMTTSSRKLRLSVMDGFDALTSVENFDLCEEVDNVFLIPDEKITTARNCLATR